MVSRNCNCKKTLRELDRIIVFDGKTLRRCDDINNKALHILTAFDTDNELIGFRSITS